MVGCLAPPFALVGVLAFRDVLRVVNTMCKPWCFKRVVQVLAFLSVFVCVTVLCAYSNIPWVGYEAVYTLVCITYAWFTAPSTAKTRRPVQQSRVSLLYLKFFGINGKVRMCHNLLLFASLMRCLSLRGRIMVTASPFTTQPLVL